MIQQKVELPAESRIILMSDSHIGHPGFREDILDDVIAEIQKPNTYWLGLGDYVEGREPGHKFYDSNSPLDVGDQYSFFFDKIRPIADKCLGMVIGNHEASLIQKTTVNPLKQFCVDNKITYLGDLGRLVIDAHGKRKYTILCAHGAGNGSKIGGNINKVADFVRTFTDVDVACFGHFHKLSEYADLSGYVNADGLQRWREVYIVTNGAMLEAYKDGSEGSYVESKLLPPTALGYAEIQFSKKGKGLKVILNPY